MYTFEHALESNEEKDDKGVIVNTTDYKNVTERLIIWLENMPAEVMRSTLSPHTDHEYSVQCHCTCHKPPLLPPDFVLGGKGSPQVPWSRHNSPRTKGSATVSWENDGSGATKVWWSRHTKGKTGGAWKKPETVKRWTKPLVAMIFSRTELQSSLLIVIFLSKQRPRLCSCQNDDITYIVL